MPDIMHLFGFKAPPAQVFRAAATAEGVRQWWTSDADLDACVGGRGDFRFYGGQSIHTVTVTAFTPPDRVVWEVVSSFRPGWAGTTISFDLRPGGGGTELRFAHRDFPEPDDTYALCTTGWGIYLARLQRFLETSEAARG